MGAAGLGHRLRLLVGLDLTERSERAFKRAVGLATAHHGQLSILHVISDDLPPKVADAHSDFAASVMQDHATRARGAGLEDVNQVMVHGHDYETIIDQANKTDADLIVLGTHRTRGIVADMLGTTADRVLRVSGRPVLLVRQPSGLSYTRILVAVDFSEASRRALEMAFTLFPGAEFVVVNTLGRSRDVSESRRTQMTETVEAHRLAMKAFIDEVAQKTGLLRDGTGPKIIEVIESGWPEDVIPELAMDRLADLVVVGTHARSGLTRALLGSVAEEIMLRAQTDVLAVPPHPIAVPRDTAMRDILLVA